MKYLRNVSVVLIFGLIVLLYNSCSDNTVSSSSIVGGGVDQTILRVDSTGQILGGDTTDWCYHGGNGVMFAPVYPNPVSSSFTWKMSLAKGDTVKLYFLRTQQDTLYLLNGFKVAGIYELTVSRDSTFLHNATRRLYFSVKRNPNTDPYCRYYGDVQFY
jgi:hypothetical protein